MTTLLSRATRLYELTKDPLMLDAVRVLSSPNQPQHVVDDVETFVDSGYAAYLKLFGNSGITVPYGYEPTRYDSDPRPDGYPVL